MALIVLCILVLRLPLHEEALSLAEALAGMRTALSTSISISIVITLVPSIGWLRELQGRRRPSPTTTVVIVSIPTAGGAERSLAVIVTTAR